MYDNACNAHAYALNREPHFFKFTNFLVDALHFYGHKHCAFSYNIKQHAPLRPVNSQLAEQRVRQGFELTCSRKDTFIKRSSSPTVLTGGDYCPQNSKLDLIKKQCGFMTRATFLPYVRYYIHRMKAIRNAMAGVACCSSSAFNSSTNWQMLLCALLLCCCVTSCSICRHILRGVRATRPTFPSAPVTLTC